MITWHLETKNLKDLKDHPKNPRHLTKYQEDQIKASLTKFGLAEKPIINTDGTLIGGHQRKKILRKLGYKKIDCWVPSETLTQIQVDELNIRLNKATGSWDWDILANEWEIPNLLEWGFTLEELELDSSPEEKEEIEEDDPLIPPSDEDAQTKTGDIYELSGDGTLHRIACGDSTDKDVVEKLLQGETPILMVTDPPYGVNYDASWREGYKNSVGKKLAKGKVQNDDVFDWSKAWAFFKGDVAYIWHAGKYCAEVQKKLIDSEYEIVSQIIWVKQHFALSRGDYHWQHEPCWYAVKKGRPHNWQGSRKESTVWEIVNLNGFCKSKGDEEESTAHSTQKPIECMTRPIRNNTAIGESVYDPFLGSGTTLMAAEQLRRNCYGIEISAAYVDIVIQRFENYMKKNNKPYLIKKNNEVLRTFNG